MPYLIDGPNLIGRHPRLSLADPDDERDLLKILADYAHHTRRKLIVFFDRGQPGSRPQRHGSLEVRFVSAPRTADEALLDYLRRVPDPRNWRVVTSDRRVAAHARQARAICLSAEEFLESLSTLRQQPGAGGQGSESGDTKEIEEWLRAFEARRTERRGGEPAEGAVGPDGIEPSTHSL